MKSAFFMLPLPFEALQLLIVIAGFLIMVSAFFPKARALAISLLLFVVTYMFLPVLDPYFELIPLWILLSVLAILLLNILCEFLVFFGFRKKKRKGWFESGSDDDSDHQKACLGRIIGGILLLPFRLSWWMLRSLFTSR